MLCSISGVGVMSNQMLYNKKVSTTSSKTTISFIRPLSLSNALYKVCCLVVVLNEDQNLENSQPDISTSFMDNILPRNHVHSCNTAAVYVQTFTASSNCFWMVWAVGRGSQVAYHQSRGGKRICLTAPTKTPTRIPTKLPTKAPGSISFQNRHTARVAYFVNLV